MRVLLAWHGARTARDRIIFARRQVPLLRHLVSQGVRPTVALLGDAGGMRADLREAGIDVEVLPALPPPPSALPGLPAAVARLHALIRRLQPDIVEGDEAMPGLAVGLAGGLAALLRRRRDTVLVYRPHFLGARLRMLLPSRIAAHLADRIIVSNEPLRRYVAAREGRPLECIEVSTSGTEEPPPVTRAEIAAARRALGIGEEDSVIVAIAYLRRQKGIDVLLRALDTLGPMRDTHLVIAGSGPDEPSLRRLAAAAPLPVHFLGHRDDVHLLIAMSDVMAIPSRDEAFGRVTLETMAGGRPVVATRVGGLVAAVVDGETGLLVPPDDPAAFGAALRTLLIDRDAARRMGERNRARYEEQFTIAHMATAWRCAWERVLADVRSARA